MNIERIKMGQLGSVLMLLSLFVSGIAQTNQSGIAPNTAQEPVPTPTSQPAPNINRAELTRIPEDAPPPKMPTPGPYVVEVFTDPGLLTHTIYEPKEKTNALRKIPVVAWGNGGCSNDNRNYRSFLTTVASHGFFIIAAGMKEPPERGTTKGSIMTDALKWAAAENKRSGSPYRGRLDLDRIGLMGYSCGGLQAIENSADTRVKSVVLFNTGTFDQNTFTNQMTAANKDSLKTIHSPIVYFIGGPIDAAFRNAEDDFKRIEKVPVFKANINTGHMGTFAHPGGGWFAEVASAWLKWTLRRDKSSSTYFEGKNCTLCLDPVWNVERKNFKS
jgi:dienelactone hydrolase